MRKLYVALAVCGLIFSAGIGGTPAAAADVPVSWVNPTMDVDNTAIPAAVLETAFSRVWIGDTATGPWTRFPDTTTTPRWPVNQITFDSATPGLAGKWFTVTFVIYDATGAKISSDFAVAAQWVPVVTPPPPPPPPPPAGPKKSKPPTGVKVGGK